MATEKGALVVIQGLDGSGKSTAAQAAAQDLSHAYPMSRIGVADSTGLYHYRAGELTGHRYSRLIELEPAEGDSKLKTIGSLGAFTLGRKFVDHKGLRESDVLISVRDPQRVDPATYAPMYSPAMGRLSPDARLRLFDRFTNSAYPDAIIQLVTDPAQSHANTQNRDMVICPHESQEKLELLAEELPMVLHAFHRLFGSPVHEVAGLQPVTAAETAAHIEALVPEAYRHAA